MIATHPTSLKTLFEYLEDHPRVRITGPTPESREPTTRDEWFHGVELGRLWFKPDPPDKPHFIPLGCALKPEAQRAETGVAFDAAGFTVTKFGVPIRVEYLP